MWTQHHNGKINEAIGDINLCNARALCLSHRCSAPTELKEESKRNDIILPFSQSCQRVMLSFEDCVQLTGNQSGQPPSLTLLIQSSCFFKVKHQGFRSAAAIYSWHCSCVCSHCQLFYLQISLLLLEGKRLRRVRLLRRQKGTWLHCRATQKLEENKLDSKFIISAWHEGCLLPAFTYMQIGGEQMKALQTGVDQSRQN